MGNVVHFSKRRGNNQDIPPPPDDNWLLARHDSLRMRSRIKRSVGSMAVALGIITAAVSGPEIAHSVQPNAVTPPVAELTLAADALLIGLGTLGVAGGIVDSGRANSLEAELMRRGIYPITRQPEPFIEV